MSSLEAGDADLLRSVAEGDEVALRTLVERHAGWLKLRLCRRTGDEDLVADALQDTFVAVWRSAAQFRGEGDVGAWLWGIAIRQLITRLRRRPSPVPAERGLIDAVSPAVRSAEDELLVAVEHGDVGTALGRLSPELRAVLQVTVLDGLTTREAARLLGIPAGTVKSRARTARAQLREQLVP